MTAAFHLVPAAELAGGDRIKPGFLPLATGAATVNYVSDRYTVGQDKVVLVVWVDEHDYIGSDVLRADELIPAEQADRGLMFSDHADRLGLDVAPMPVPDGVAGLALTGRGGRR